VFYLGRHEEFKNFFSKKVEIRFCNDVYSLVEVLGHEYNPHQWRLFIDSSNVSLMLFLLHDGNRYPSNPLTHSANIKASFQSIWEV